VGAKVLEPEVATEAPFSVAELALVLLQLMVVLFPAVMLVEMRKWSPWDDNASAIPRAGRLKREQSKCASQDEKGVDFTYQL